MSYEYERRKGGCLNFFIILLLGGSIVQGVISLALFELSTVAGVVGELPCAASFACGVALFKGKRWGFYGYAAMQALAALVVLGFGGVQGLPTAAVGVVATAILWALLRPVWAYMD